MNRVPQDDGLTPTPAHFPLEAGYLQIRKVVSAFWVPRYPLAVRLFSRAPLDE